MRLGHSVSHSIGDKLHQNKHKSWANPSPTNSSPRHFSKIHAFSTYRYGQLLLSWFSSFLFGKCIFGPGSPPRENAAKARCGTVNALGIGNAQNKKLVIFFEFHEVRSCEQGVADGEVWVILPAARASLHHFAHQILFLRLR